MHTKHEKWGRVMNILFITIENYKSVSERSIYLDLVNKFIEKGHYVTTLSACESRDRNSVTTKKRIQFNGGEIIKVNIPNITKMSNYILKGINLFLSIPLFDIAAKKAMKEKQYDLVIYGSPPISIYKAVSSVKKKQTTMSILMLKDIWPYDCLFGDVLTTYGWKKIAFNILVAMAKKLYEVSDVIGCMSPANIRFLIENEPSIKTGKIIEFPNTVCPFKISLETDDKYEIRKKYGIPCDKTIFVYGGNLGISQGIDFAINSVKYVEDIEQAYFVFVGGGTERKKLKSLFESNELSNFLLLPPMEKDEYETFVYACDVGLIYLNHDCLAPNYPSRLLTYMQASLPVLCATDTYTDVGKIAVDNQYGLWCESIDDCLDDFYRNVDTMCNKDERIMMGRNSYHYFMTHYTTDCSYRIVSELLEHHNTK